MKRSTYSNAALKAVLLKDRYPDGEGWLLMDNTVLAYSMANDTVTVNTSLPDDHWAFTHLEEPVRFVVDDHSAQVRDTNTGEWVASFATRGAAINYAEILNSR